MDRIEHSGVVKRVDAERVCVEITAHGACGSCKAREACGLGETGQKSWRYVLRLRRRIVPATG